MASADPNYSFDCPQCKERLSVSSEKIGNQIHCAHCAEQVHVPNPMSTADKLLAGLVDDEDEFEHPGSLKIDGIGAGADDGSTWHMACHICDSTLLVSSQQVGTKVKCNDCYSMLPVLPNAAAKLTAGIADGSDLEVVDEEVVIPASSPASKSVGDSGEFSLAPAVELDPEIAEAQKEIFLDDLVEEDDPMEVTSNPMFAGSSRSARAPDTSEDDDDDEMIEMLDVPPEQLNEPAAYVAPVVAARSPVELPRMPRKKGKRPAAIPVESNEADEEEAPIRVHAKRRPKKEKSSTAERTRAPKGFQFESASLNDVLDNAMGILKTGKIWIWALVSIVTMAIGSSIWHWIASYQVDSETATLGSRMLNWGAGTVFGTGTFLVGYIILLFIGGVIFRETAHGETKVDSVSVSNAPEFTSTMLLFGFSMMIAALPCMLFGLMFLTVPFQFLLGGCFLFAAWQNQSAFSIVSANIFNSFSQYSESWKKWFAVAAIAAAGGFIGGLLMEAYWPIISVFTSIAGSIIVTLSTLLYAAVSGWHCGNVVEKMKQADG